MENSHHSGFPENHWWVMNPDAHIALGPRHGRKFSCSSAYFPTSMENSHHLGFPENHWWAMNPDAHIAVGPRHGRKFFAKNIFSSTICRYFAEGRCKNGNHCHFLHPQLKTPYNSSQRKEIHSFGNYCRCKKLKFSGFMTFPFACGNPHIICNPPILPCKKDFKINYGKCGEKMNQMLEVNSSISRSGHEKEFIATEESDPEAYPKMLEVNSSISKSGHEKEFIATEESNPEAYPKMLEVNSSISRSGHEKEFIATEESDPEADLMEDFKYLLDMMESDSEI